MSISINVDLFIVSLTFFSHGVIFMFSQLLKCIHTYMVVAIQLVDKSV